MNWRTFRMAPDGVRTEIAFERMNGRKRVVVRRTAPAELLNGIMNDNEARANESRIKGSMRGTQKHRQRVARLPDFLYWELRRKFGSPKHNPLAWKIYLNSMENRNWRTTEGNL